MKNLLYILAFAYMGCTSDLPAPEPILADPNMVEFNGEMIEVGKAYPANTMRSMEAVTVGWYNGWPYDVGQNSWIVVYSFDSCSVGCVNNGIELEAFDGGAWAPLTSSPVSSPFREMPIDLAAIDLDVQNAACNVSYGNNTVPGVYDYHRYRVTNLNSSAMVQVFFFSAWVDQYGRNFWAIVDIDRTDGLLTTNDQFEFFAYSRDQFAIEYFGDECAIVGPTLIR